MNYNIKFIIFDWIYSFVRPGLSKRLQSNDWRLHKSKTLFFRTFCRTVFLCSLFSVRYLAFPCSNIEEILCPFFLWDSFSPRIHLSLSHTHTSILTHTLSNIGSFSSSLILLSVSLIHILFSPSVPLFLTFSLPCILAFTQTHSHSL